MRYIPVSRRIMPGAQKNGKNNAVRTETLIKAPTMKSRHRPFCIISPLQLLHFIVVEFNSQIPLVTLPLFARGAFPFHLSKRDRQFDSQTAPVSVLDLYPMLVAVEAPQSGACVGQPDAFLKLFGALFVTWLQPGAIINYLKLDHSVPAFSADFDAPG